MASNNADGKVARRFFVGIGVGSYDDATLNLKEAEADVVKVAEWFIHKSGMQHTLALEHLGKSPTTSQVLESLPVFLRTLDRDDVVVIYAACHGELEGAKAYLFGRNTPREGLAGMSIEAGALGSILGQSKPHNLLVIIDACVAGRLASAVERNAEDTSDDLNNRDPQRPMALVVLSSTYGRDPAYDGRFAEAFVRVVSEERWTGTTSRWMDIGQLIRGLNEELKDIAPTQVAELRSWITDIPELIPNPNVATRKLGQLIADEEFQAHFDPAARGAARGETGTFFTGRVRELRRVTSWLEGSPASSLLVITGSPGSGKSALLSRVAVLADPTHRPDKAMLADLVDGTVPPAGALDAVIWCHNKTERQIIEELARALGGSASTPDTLLQLTAGRSATIALDALDETEDGQASKLASQVLKPLANDSGIRLLVATRRRPVRHANGEVDLLDCMGTKPESVIDLDASPDTRSDMRDYVEARIRSTAARGLFVDAALADLADQVADAAGHSFLVAAIAARAAAAGKLSRRADGTYVLPTEAGEALARYIDALPDPAKASGLLRPLAWSGGAGLPWGTLWPRLATILATVTDPAPITFDDDDVRGLLESAGDLVVESIEAGQPVYRLFHEALAEHLRAGTDAIRAHDALAQAMLESSKGRSWRQVERYVAGNLPVHLLGAGRMDELLELLIDPTWDRARREATNDPLATAGIVDAAIERLLTDSPTDLRAVPLCVAYSRAMTTAAPLILDVLARSGQLARAEMMANNLAYVPDRMLAYRYLCAGYSRERDRVAARRCFDEVRRSLPTMPQTHQPMAWYWVAETALGAGLTDQAQEAAKAAVDVALEIQGDGWDLPNGYFWAGRACVRAGWQSGIERIREGLDGLEPGIARRNQSLQAASAAGHRTFLQKRLAEYLEGARYPAGMLRDGNLALALVDAGMETEAAQVFDLVKHGAPQGQADSNKRWAWALAESGRMEQAIQALGHVYDPIEKGKAIARIAAVARKRADETSHKMVASLVRPLLGTLFEPRSRARLIRVLWMAGERAEALSLAEQEIAFGHDKRAMADPRDGVGPEGLPAWPPFSKKVRKREMASSVVPVSDEQWSHKAEVEASAGNLETAKQDLANITVPLFRARALAAIAKQDPDSEQAIASWIRAVANARRAGRGAVDELWPIGIAVLNRAGRSEDGEALKSRIDAVDLRWELESFSEQYETLRRTMPGGADRTGRLEVLLLIPRRLATTHQWSRDDVRASWESGEDGKRLFALGLIEGDASLADVGVLVEGIRAPRSAFEQYHALMAALAAKMAGGDCKEVRTALESEVRGEPRADGTDPGIKAGSDRMVVVQKLLK